MGRIATLLACLSSLELVACAHDAAPGLKMLNTRADYEAEAPEVQTLTLGTADGSGAEMVPVRVPPKVVNIWMHPHETPDHEYFWGAWLSVVVAGEEWGVQYQRPAVVPEAAEKPKK